MVKTTNKTKTETIELDFALIPTESGKLKVTPLRDRIVVRKHAAPDKTPGGIVLPDSCKDPAMTGDVLAVGPGRTSSQGYLIPVEVEKGRRVVFPKYEGLNPIIDGESFYIIPESKILLSY